MVRMSVVLTAMVLLLGGCGSHPALDSVTASQMLDGSVPPGKARIYVFAGTAYAEIGPSIGYPQAFIVSIDGTKVARVGPGEAVAVDVPRGHHIVSRNLITVWGDSPDAISFDLGGVAEGEQIYVGVDRVTGGGGAVPIVTGGGTFASGFAAGAAAGLLHGELKRLTDAPHDPGEYLDLRDDGPDMLKHRSLVVPDAAAVAQLNKPKA